MRAILKTEANYILNRKVDSWGHPTKLKVKEYTVEESVLEETMDLIAEIATHLTGKLVNIDPENDKEIGEVTDYIHDELVKETIKQLEARIA